MPRNTTRTGRRCTSDAVALGIATTARTLLLTAVALVLWALVPACLGWPTTTVVSGSMAPAVQVGDVVAAAPLPETARTPGRVLLVDDPDHPGRLRLHRLDQVRDDGMLVLRGDANPRPDRSAVSPSAVRGVALLRFPAVGLPATWLREGDLAHLAAMSALVLALLLLAGSDRGIRDGAPCRRCGTPRVDLVTPPPTETRTASTVPATLLAVLAAVTAAAIGTGPGAGAAFSAETGAAVAAATAKTFPCFRGFLDSPSLAWDFDEKSGPDVVDHVGRQPAVMTGHAQRHDASCADNPSLRFEDAADSPRATSSTKVGAPSTFSIEVWFQTDRAQGSIMSFGSGQTAASGYKDRRLYITSDGTLAFGVQDSGNATRRAVTSSARVDDGRWHMAVGTSTPGHMALWLDGVQVADRSDNTKPFTYEGYWRVGRESTADWPGADKSKPNFVGEIDTARVYNRELPWTSVATHFAVGR
ncbi:LamG domain-containing protein [Curtobacterium albidum]|uniref:LamG-like jellyroll fold domain-containing protein n=1 Tax=Curtobacterium citreum TaxID=2036 RepID=UPI00202738CA|nr:LamG-like jellyroll fold domain-containing protein [Curtobacterium albidum]MCL9666625.1 LamG domain-containing protein [Curtobacterium albidum]